MQMQQTGYGMLKLHSRKSEKSYSNTRLLLRAIKLFLKAQHFENTVREWCDKCQYIRISYPAAKNYLDGFSAFLEVLYNVKKSGVILDSQKQKFYDLLIANADNFRTLYMVTKLIYSRKFASSILKDLPMKKSKKFIILFLLVHLRRIRQSIQNIINNKVEEYKRNSKSAKLKKIWKEKTNTDTPREWSKKYKMPILCMVEDKGNSNSESCIWRCKQSAS